MVEVCGCVPSFSPVGSVVVGLVLVWFGGRGSWFGFSSSFGSVRILVRLVRWLWVRWLWVRFMCSSVVVVSIQDSRVWLLGPSIR